jgi:hypothetical protein
VIATHSYYSFSGGSNDDDDDDGGGCMPLIRACFSLASMVCMENKVGSFGCFVWLQFEPPNIRWYAFVMKWGL